MLSAVVVLCRYEYSFFRATFLVSSSREEVVTEIARFAVAVNNYTPLVIVLV